MSKKINLKEIYSLIKTEVIKENNFSNEDLIKDEVENLIIKEVCNRIKFKYNIK